LIDHFGAEFFVTDVSVDEQTFATVLFHQLLGLFRVFMLFKVDNGHVRALLGESSGDSATDAAVTAGNNSDFTAQFATTRVAFILGFGPRLHLVLPSRTLRLMLSRLMFFLFCHNEKCSFLNSGSVGTTVTG